MMTTVIREMITTVIREVAAAAAMMKTISIRITGLQNVDIATSVMEAGLAIRKGIQKLRAVGGEILPMRAVDGTEIQKAIVRRRCVVGRKAIVASVEVAAGLLGIISLAHE